MDFNQQFNFQNNKSLDIINGEFKTISELPTDNEIICFIDKYEDPDKMIKITQNGQTVTIEILQIIKGDTSGEFISIIKKQIILDSQITLGIYKLNKHSYLFKYLKKLYCLKITKSRIKIIKTYNNFEIGHLYRIDDQKFIVQGQLGLKIIHSNTFKILKTIQAEDILLLGSLTSTNEILIKKNHNLFTQNICDLKMKELPYDAYLQRVMLLNKKYLLKIEYLQNEALIYVCNLKLFAKEEEEQKQEQVSDMQKDQLNQKKSLLYMNTEYNNNYQNPIEKNLLDIRNIQSCQIFTHKQNNINNDYLIIVAHTLDMKSQCLFFKIESNSLIECPDYYFNYLYPSLVQCLSFHDNEIYFFIQFEMSNKLFITNKLFPK